MCVRSAALLIGICVRSIDFGRAWRFRSPVPYRHHRSAAFSRAISFGDFRSRPNRLWAVGVPSSTIISQAYGRLEALVGYRRLGGPKQVKRVFARVVHEAQETLEPFGVDWRRLELQLETQTANEQRRHTRKCAVAMSQTHTPAGQLDGSSAAAYAHSAQRRLRLASSHGEVVLSGMR